MVLALAAPSDAVVFNVGGPRHNGSMTFVDLDDLPAADPVPSERTMLRSLIDSLVATEAQIGSLQAHQAMLYTAVTELVELQTSRLPGAARRDREMPLREATAEIAAALRVTERTVQRRMSDATTLMMRFTGTFTALAEGRITRTHAGVIIEAGCSIEDDAARAEFELAALDRAEIETVGRLRSIVRTIAEKAQPVSIAERHRLARDTVACSSVTSRTTWQKWSRCSPRCSRAASSTV